MRVLGKDPSQENTFVVQMSAKEVKQFNNRFKNPLNIDELTEEDLEFLDVGMKMLDHGKVYYVTRVLTPGDPNLKHPISSKQFEIARRHIIPDYEDRKYIDRYFYFWSLKEKKAIWNIADGFYKVVHPKAYSDPKYAKSEEEQYKRVDKLLTQFEEESE